MVRYLIKHGTKIKLLPPPTPPEEQLECPKCKVEFDTGQYRRACIEVCGHVTCLQCIATRLNLKEGCEDCAKERAPPEVEPRKKKQPVLVLLPVLSKQGVSRESDEFPEIERLSLSALPVLERAGEVGSEEENEIEELGVDVDEEDEEVEDIELPYEGLRLMDDEEVKNTGESETVPEFIDISGDDDIPIVDLADSDDDNENVENEEEFLSYPIQTPSDETVDEKVDEQDEIDEVDSEFEVEIAPIPKSQPVRESVIRSTASLFETETPTEKTTELVEFVNELEEADAEGDELEGDTGVDEIQEVDLEDDESEEVDVETVETTETENFDVAQTDISDNVEADNQIENNSEEDDSRKDSLENNEERENSTTVEIGAIENNVPEPDQEITLDENGNQPIPSTSRRERRKMLSNYNNYKTAYRNMGFGKHICQYCSDSFRDRSTLGLHLTQEHWDLRPFPCDICNWPFDSARNLEMHRLTHTNERPFKCSLCDSAFNRNFTLRKHMDKLHNVILPKMNRSKRGKYKKRILQKVANGKLEDAESISEKIRNFKVSKKRKYTRRKYKRARLNLEKELNYLEDEDDWEDNVEAYKHKDSHECVMCQEKFNRRFSLERHMEHTHGVRVRLHPDETPQGKEYCPECQSLFGSPNCIKVAYSQCGHISCVDCVIRAELGCGQCTTETAHKVGDVLPTTPEKQKINEQAVITRREDDDDDDDDDNEPFDELVAEMDIIANLEVEPPSMKKPEKSYKCKYCVWPIEFSERRDLGNHMQHAHADKRPYPCEICNWPFASLKDLERHQLIHANEKPYKCAMCKNSFNRKSARDRHVEKVHLKWRRI